MEFKIEWYIMEYMHVLNQIDKLQIFIFRE